LRKLRRALIRAKRRGHHAVALHIKVKFHRVLRKARKYRMIVRRLRKRIMRVKINRYRKLIIRTHKRANKLRRMYRIAKAKSHGHYSFCVNVLKGQYKKALRLARKYKHIFRSIRVRYHKH